MDHFFLLFCFKNEEPNALANFYITYCLQVSSSLFGSSILCFLSNSNNNLYFVVFFATSIKLTNDLFLWFSTIGANHTDHYVYVEFE